MEKRIIVSQYRKKLSDFPVPFFVSQLQRDEDNNITDILIIYANQAFADLEKKDLKSLIGASVYKLSADFFDYWLSTYLNVIKSHKSSIVSYYSSISKSYLAGEIFNIEGDFFGNLIFNDQERQESMNELNSYKKILSGSHIALWSYDIENNTLTFQDEGDENYSKRHFGLTQSVIHDVPNCMFKYGVTDQDRANLGKIYATLAAGKQLASGDYWFKTGPKEEPICERIVYYIYQWNGKRPKKAYGIGLDITSLRKEEEAKVSSIKEIIEVNPAALGVYRLNLSKDSFLDQHGSSRYLTSVIKGQTVNDLADAVLSLIPDTKQRSEASLFFSRESFLSSFSKGKTKSEKSYQRFVAPGILHWVTTYVEIFQNGPSNDIEAAVFSLDTEEKKKNEMIMQSLTDESYDFIGLLDLNTMEVNFRFVGSSSPEDMVAIYRRHNMIIDYSTCCMHLADSWVDPDYRSLFLENASITNIREKLKTNKIFEFNVLGSHNEKPSFKSFTLSYLDKSQREILIEQRDITPLYLEQQASLKKSQDSAKKAYEILNKVNCGIALIRFHGTQKSTFEYLNNKLAEMLKIDIDSDEEFDIYHNDAYRALDKRDYARVSQIVKENLLKDNFSIKNLRIVAIDGSVLWVNADFTFRKEEDGCRIFYVTFTNVTEELSLQNELKERLDKEEELRKEAIAANDSKSRFLSNVSHDMRTPLNGVLGYTDLAMKAKNEQEMRSYLEKINKSGALLLELINDTLDLNKIENGVVTLKKTIIYGDDLVQKIITSVKPSMDAKNIEFSLDISHTSKSYVNIDELRFQEICINLLSNAMKYTPNGGKINFSIDTISMTETEVNDRIVISDNGSGMSKEFIERMYEPFTQERTAKTTSIPGSGLGLTIVKKLVDLMGGQISCSSQLGKGTTFTILLTIERIKDYHPPLEIDEKPIETLKNKRILLAEDNAINAEIATTILTSSGLLVESAANGKEAVDKFAASAPNYYSAILMDIRMPIMDGRQASLEIRGMPRPDSQLIPIIAMTADAYADDVRKCLEAGMDAHIAKPIQPELMLKELARLIK